MLIGIVGAVVVMALGGIIGSVIWSSRNGYDRVEQHSNTDLSPCNITDPAASNSSSSACDEGGSCMGNPSLDPADKHGEKHLDESAAEIVAPNASAPAYGDDGINVDAPCVASAHAIGVEILGVAENQTPVWRAIRDGVRARKAPGFVSMRSLTSPTLIGESGLCLCCYGIKYGCLNSKK
jgi:hypothetical protein